eukprot:15464954-Alexandrium_andersonii.AAC.1
MVGTCKRSLECLVKVSSGPRLHPEGAVAPARPTGQTALSVVPNRRNSEDPPLPHCQAREAPRLSAFRRFAAAERAIWPAQGGFRVRAHFGPPLR